MKVETLQKIVEKFGYSWEEGEHCVDGSQCYTIDGCFFVSQTDEPVMARTLRGARETGRNKWLVEVEVRFLGDRDNPPDSDLKEISRVDSLDDAVRLVLVKIEEDKINNVFESEGMAELYEENELYY